MTKKKSKKSADNDNQEIRTGFTAALLKYLQEKEEIQILQEKFYSSPVGELLK